MSKKPFLSLMAALALACALPACGDDEPAGSTGGVSSQDVDAAVENCKESVRQQAQLSDDAKSEIEALCDEAKGGDEEDVKAASRKVCERMIEETVPAGEARDQALETCKTATQ